MGGVIDTGGGTSIPYDLGMRGELLHTSRCHSIPEAEVEAGEEVAAVVVWTAVTVAGAAAGVAETGSTFSGRSSGAAEPVRQPVW